MEFEQPSFDQVKLASGQPVDIEYAVHIEFSLGENKFSDEFFYFCQK